MIATDPLAPTSRFDRRAALTDIPKKQVFRGDQRLSEPIDPFKIRAHVPRFAEHVADNHASSAATRARLASRLDVAYGDGPDEKLDLFFPGPALPDRPAPVHLFIHGGYWRANSKNDFSFVADSVAAQGAIAAILDYSLMPGARMGALVDQVRRAATWLGRHAQEFGGDPEAISASGHSAGGHLVSYLVCRAPHEAEFSPTPVRSVLAVSGLFDLAPIALSFLQAEIHLTADEIAQWSPCDAVPRPGSLVRLAVGGVETAPFFELARRFADRLSSFGLAPRSSILAGEDHMTIVRALGRPGTECATLLAETIAASR
jgi:arylformamidase